MSCITLKTVIFLGSARDISPPWGGDKRLGDRVLNHVKTFINAREGTLGDDTVKHSITVLDPLELFGAGGALAESGGELRTPSFFYKAGSQPEGMAAVQQTIKDADCYIIISPEYNHSVPPALAGLMGTFGGSNYAYKPSATITYSPGPWGGMRAAVALRPFLSELGCLPVSKLTGYPNASEMFNEDGTAKDPANRMLKQLAPMIGELEWMAMAMKAQREKTGPPSA
eukprot:CAMPEP_0180136856 /NCGR_PEP_ID=MMETSP0986-20121125/11803_1 /TAXON_ID=697907 /ORGANISM="non described non described, Strain CCMP2293" /LENGTH=226 /DNA_ID=CAMNT_0022078081 /DNA_START=19 /DNA_END=699 /DNA_ORIENTATION=+